MNPEIEEQNPDRLIKFFSESRLVKCLAIAAGIHVVVLLGTSFGYLRETLVAPGESVSHAEAVDSGEGGADESNPPDAVVAQEGVEVVQETFEPAVQTPAAISPAAAGSQQEQVLEERKDSAVVREITEAAPAAEIPRVPADEGLSLEDTNPGL